jgi:hypothetical protein
MITIVRADGTSMERVYRHGLYTFDMRNWDFDQEKAERRNANWMD